MSRPILDDDWGGESAEDMTDDRCQRCETGEGFHSKYCEVADFKASFVSGEWILEPLTSIESLKDDKAY